MSEIYSPDNIEELLEEPHKVIDFMFTALMLSNQLTADVYQGYELDIKELKTLVTEYSDDLGFTDKDCISLAKVVFSTVRTVVDKTLKSDQDQKNEMILMQFEPGDGRVN